MRLPGGKVQTALDVAELVERVSDPVGRAEQRRAARQRVINGGGATDSE